MEREKMVPTVTPASSFAIKFIPGAACSLITALGCFVSPPGKRGIPKNAPNSETLANTPPYFTSKVVRSHPVSMILGKYNSSARCSLAQNVTESMMS
jgi:hypothetical protein